MGAVIVLATIAYTIWLLSSSRKPDHLGIRADPALLVLAVLANVAPALPFVGGWLGVDFLGGHGYAIMCLTTSVLLVALVAYLLIRQPPLPMHIAKRYRSGLWPVALMLLAVYAIAIGLPFFNGSLRFGLLDSLATIVAAAANILCALGVMHYFMSQAKRWLPGTSAPDHQQLR